MAQVVLKKLVIKRGVIKRKLTQMEAFIRDFEQTKNQNSIHEIQERLDVVSQLQREFDDIHLEILMTEDLTHVTGEGDHTEDATQIHQTEADEIEERIFKVKAQLKTMLGSGPKSEIVDTSGISQSHNINLPVLNLPEFEGTYGNWPTFYEAFNSLIHDNKALNDCQRFHYLRSCLKNEPLRSIESLNITGKNYEAAWTLLKKRYENRRLIVTEHIQSILFLPEIQKASAMLLRKLLDQVRSHLAALKSLEIAVEGWDQILILVLVAKLDFHSRRDWESSLGSDLTNYKAFEDFLEKKCLTLESINAGKIPQSPKVNNSFGKSNKISMPATQLLTAPQAKSRFGCLFCSKPTHYVNKCEVFAKLKLEDRIREIKNRNLCFNCLRANHTAAECRSGGCKVCRSRHHTLLHHQESEAPVNATSVVQSILKERGNQVLLSTAEILIEDATGSFQNCRALLDVGSQLNLVNESLITRLGLSSRDTTLAITGVGSSSSQANKSVAIVLKSRHETFRRKIQCFILSKITENLPTSTFEKDQNAFRNTKIELADPEFNVSRPIDILLGAELFWDLIQSGRVQVPGTNLLLIQSKLGWLIGTTQHNSSTHIGGVLCHQVVTTQLDNLVERFWREQEICENVGQNNWSEEEIRCENQFIETHQRDEDGRFIIQLPFKNSRDNELGNSENIAIKRFYNLERKLQKNLEIKQKYISVLKDYLDSGIIEQAKDNERERSKSTYYLPHSAVIKPDNASTKLRIVFDASCKSSNNLSLNDLLMTGPNIQNDMVALLTKFRTYQVVLSADITKMFLQIKVDPKHLDYLRFFWRDSPEENISIYRLTRLVFGLTNSPYTAMRCIRQLSNDSKEIYPIASAVLSTDIFMDDILCGASCLEDAMTLRDQLIEILGSAGFKLDKYASNNPKLVPTSSNKPLDSIEIGKTQNTKILGLYWNHSTDTLKYNYTSIKLSEKPTKRSVLSLTASLFDPLGLIAPIVVKAKIIMQSLWTYKDINWDSYIPLEADIAWAKFVQSLDELKYIEIPRKVIPNDVSEIDLVAFGDASLSAMGAAIYVRAKLSSGVYISHLLTAKTRLAPIKSITLPRLELNAALLATRLMEQTSKSLGLKINKRYFFTDSMIVLHYLNKPASNWQVYVARRVGEIQNLTDSDEWFHVDSHQNPADILSRGAYPAQLKDNSLYWRGPEWLQRDQQYWPENRFKPLADESKLEQRSVNLIANIAEELPVLSKYSNFEKLLRVVAYCLRYANNSRMRNRKARITGILSPTELTKARNAIIKSIQGREFATDLLVLEKNEVVLRNSRIKTLSPFVDKDGLLRVGGRLGSSELSYDNKHPIILPAKHHITRLLVKLQHEKQLHAGATQTLAALRTEYWPLRPRNLIRQIIRNCYRCFRVNPKLCSPMMGELPKERLIFGRPFKSVGLDYFGPLYLKTGAKRSTKTVKAWGALFVCLATKAVHIELVGDLTSESFINALRRLIARRGTVANIFCDNATTFVGAKRELDEISDFIKSNKFYAEIREFLMNEKINWKLIPPRAPNFGGVWERLVRSVKQHLKRIVGNVNLNWEEMYTFLTRIEAVVNSRPLTPLSNDPHDFQILTPAHFLVGESLTAPVEVDLTDVSTHRLSRWQLVQRLQQHFWKRWQKEVLTQLQARARWPSSSSTTVEKDMLVVVAEENLPPLCWRTGRIIDVFPGPDGVVRVVNVRTPQGVIKRTVRKLAVLPQDSNGESVSDEK